MRISNTMVSNTFLRNLSNNYNTMINYQEKVSSGKAISKLSEDPVGAVTIMRCTLSINRVEQYNDNIAAADDLMLFTEESVLELNELVKSSLELVTQGSNDWLTAEDKEALAVVIGNYRDEMVDIGNAQVSGRYIFGGYNTTQPPFTFDGGTGELLYNGYELVDDNIGTNPGLFVEMNNYVEFEVGSDITTKASVLGTDAFGIGADNLYQVMDEVYDLLMSDADASLISPYIESLQDCQSQLLSLEAEIGGICDRLDLMTSRYERDWLNYTETRSEIEDTDIAEAYMKFSQSEAIYSAALQISSKIIQPSLVDYLT